MKIKAIGLAVVLVVVLGAAVWLGVRQYGSGSGGLPPLNTEQVERGDVSQRTIAHGSLRPVQTVIVGSQVSGIVDEVLVDFNSPVSRGQAIARIDPSTFAAELRSAEAELESAEAGLELVRHQWQRVQELRKLEFVPPSDVDETRSSLRQSEAQLQVRRHDVERAQRELERSTITAPSDGIVISRNVEPGQTVAASLNAPELFELATDLSEMQIHAMVSEADIGTVAPGQSARFVVDAYRDRDFVGEVVQVRNAPIVEDNVVHYETIIAVDNDEQLLRPGMTAEISIITDETHDVLRLRNNALRARLPDDIRPTEPEDEPEEGEARVYVLQNGELTARTVRTGLNDGSYTEIVSGLREGDTLAVGLSLTTEENGNRRTLFGGEQAEY